MVIIYNSPNDYIIPNLKADEIACNCCGFIDIDYRFLWHWGVIRQEWGAPLKMTSICRCPKHNKAVGGHKSSLHLTSNQKHGTTTHAGDISTAHCDSRLKKEFSKLAQNLGWSIGCAENFIHIDRRTDVINYKQATFFYGDPPSWYGV